MNRMQEQRLRQLGYLKRSAALFDQGHLDEAVLIATSLRVLFYDGPRARPGQGSLLKLLGSPGIKLRTTCAPEVIEGRVVSLDCYMHLPNNILPWQMYLDDNNHFLTLSEW